MVIDLDECGVEPGQILADGVRQWRPDCKAGQFKIGASNMRGQVLEMEIIAAQSYYGSLFGYEPMNWIGVLFVDNTSVLSSILFKTESMDNFLELNREIKSINKSLLGKTICGRMSKRVGKDSSSYWAVEFDLVDRIPRFADAIAEFRRREDYTSLIQFRETEVESKSQILATIRASA